MKHYVSKEIAIKLKEIEFPLIEDDESYESEDTYYGFFIEVPDPINYLFIYNPEMYEVQDWFRDKDIEIWVGFYKQEPDLQKYKYYPVVSGINIAISKEEYPYKIKTTYGDYYEALEAGILKAIEIYEKAI